MDKRKRLIIIVLVVVIVLAAIVGAVTYFVRNSKDSTVDVFSMELLNSSGWFYDDEEISGTVTSDYVQEVYADSSETVKKVYVEEGDTVEVGDKLLKYDVEEQQLDVKLQKLQIQSMKLDIEDLEKELEELKNTKTVGAVDSSGSALLSASANLSSLKSSVTVSLLRADADDDTGESSGTTEDTSGTTEEGSGTTATTEESSGTTATTEDSSGTTSTTEDSSGTTTTTEEDSGTTATTEDSSGTSSSTTLRTQIKNRKTSASSGSGTEDDPYKYDLAEDGTIRGAVIMNLISNGEYGNFREYEVNEDGSKGSKINTLRITPDTVFTESLSSFAWYTISDLLENLVTVDSIKIKPAKSTVKTGQSYTFKAKLTGQNKDLVTVTWQLKGNKSSSTTLKSGVLKVASGETAKTLKIIAYAGTEKAVLKVSVTQSSSSSGSSGSSTSSTSSSSSSSGSSSSSSSSYSDDDDTTTYTAAELKEAIADKEDELEEAKQELKEARINYKEAKKEVQAATIKATISGVVTLAYTADAMPTDSPAIIVRAEEGMYVKASVSELALDTVQVGGTITCTSWESGEEYEAVITEISEYPESSDSSDYYGTSNPNSSYYPIVAYIEDADGLIKDETVTITYNSQSMGTVSEDDIYLQKAYIKSDDGGKYVYKQGENGRLEKQYIQTGATVYGQYVEILSGITLEDYIAFPYGNNVKEGAKTEISDDEDDIIY